MNITQKDILRLAIDDLENSLALKLLSCHDNILSVEQWKLWAVQRYLAAQAFNDLLLGCIRCAISSGESDLASILQENLDDEMGIKEGEHSPELEHESWRKDFYFELGITGEELAKAVPLPGTIFFNNIIRQLVDSSDCLQMAGALLILEGTIPHEFAKIKRGRDIVFPNLIEKARVYIDDHIIHDATSHFPKLAGILDKYNDNGYIDSRVESGALVCIEARKKFYQDISKSFQSVPVVYSKEQTLISVQSR